MHAIVLVAAAVATFGLAVGPAQAAGVFATIVGAAGSGYEALDVTVIDRLPDGKTGTVARLLIGCRGPERMPEASIGFGAERATPDGAAALTYALDGGAGVTLEGTGVDGRVQVAGEPVRTLVSALAAGKRLSLADPAGHGAAFEIVFLHGGLAEIRSRCAL
jgi:hypothetical protein